MAPKMTPEMAHVSALDGEWYGEVRDSNEYQEFAFICDWCEGVDLFDWPDWKVKLTPSPMYTKGK